MADATLSSPIVMYVEDQPVNVALMEALFRRRGDLQLVVATSGGEAVQRARTIEPALLLLDLRLPDCHGTELLPELRRLPGCRGAAAIAVTADHEFDIEGTGFREIWTKPLNMLRVLARLEALLPPPPRSDSTAVRAELQRAAPGSKTNRLMAAGLRA